jgi:hypothetical protein
MNVKRYLLAALALFVFFFLYEWLVNGVLLTGAYMESPQVWRSEADMASKMPIYLMVQIILAAWVAFIFTRLFKEGGVANGLLFGLYFGVFAGFLTSAWYLWLPVSGILGWAWFATGFFESIFGGLIIGAIYKAVPYRKKK